MVMMAVASMQMVALFFLVYLLLFQRQYLQTGRVFVMAGQPGTSVKKMAFVFLPSKVHPNSFVLMGLSSERKGIPADQKEVLVFAPKA
jgi:hypothetical protein